MTTFAIAASHSLVLTVSHVVFPPTPSFSAAHAAVLKVPAIELPPRTCRGVAAPGAPFINAR
jgi:hypothetical protein